MQECGSDRQNSVGVYNGDLREVTLKDIMLEKDIDSEETCEAENSKELRVLNGSLREVDVKEMVLEKENDSNKGRCVTDSKELHVLNGDLRDVKVLEMENDSNEERFIKEDSKFNGGLGEAKQMKDKMEKKESDTDENRCVEKKTTSLKALNGELRDDRQVKMMQEESEEGRCDTKKTTLPQVFNGEIHEVKQVRKMLEEKSDAGRCETKTTSLQMLREEEEKKDKVQMLLQEHEEEKDKLSRASDASNRKNGSEGDDCERPLLKEGEEAAQPDSQPPDGGWGWVVAFGASLIAATVPTLAPSFGVLFAPQLLQWGASSTAVAVLFNAFMVAWKVTGVVAPTLTSEVGFRRVAMTGTLLTACCLAVSAFATSAAYLFVSFSLGCGVGCGLSCVGFLILSHYFKRRRGLAHAIHTSGMGVGRFLSPLLIQLLQETYGHRGATLLLGGVVLHGFLGATLYHPLRWHTAPQPPPTQHQQSPLMPPAPPPAHKGRVVARSRSLTEGSTDPGVEPRPRLRSSHSLTSYSTSKLSLASLDPDFMSSVASLDTAASTEASGQAAPQTPQTRRRGVLHRLCRTVARIGNALLRDLAILRRPLVLAIACSSMLVLNAHLNFSVLLPFAMQAAGFPLHTAAWCLSLIGVTNLLFRMLTATLSDYAWFNMRLVCLLALATMAAAASVFPFQTGVASTAAVVGVWGVSLGVYQGINNLYMVRLVGVQNLAPMLGSRNLTVALGFVTIGPLLGVVRDASGSYAVSCWVVASLIIVSFTLYLLMPAAVAYDKRRREKEEERAAASAV